MMDIETIKRIIIEGQDFLKEVEFIPRKFEFEQAARYVFVGVRQCGKSYL